MILTQGSAVLPFLFDKNFKDDIIKAWGHTRKRGQSVIA